MPKTAIPRNISEIEEGSIYTDQDQVSQQEIQDLERSFDKRRQDYSLLKERFDLTYQQRGPSVLSENLPKPGIRDFKLHELIKTFQTQYKDVEAHMVKIVANTKNRMQPGYMETILRDLNDALAALKRLNSSRTSLSTQYAMEYNRLYPSTDSAPLLSDHQSRAEKELSNELEQFFEHLEILDLETREGSDTKFLIDFLANSCSELINDMYAYFCFDPVNAEKQELFKKLILLKQLVIDKKIQASGMTLAAESIAEAKFDASKLTSRMSSSRQDPIDKIKCIHQKQIPWLYNTSTKIKNSPVLLIIKYFEFKAKEEEAEQRTKKNHDDLIQKSVKSQTKLEHLIELFPFEDTELLREAKRCVDGLKTHQARLNYNVPAIQLPPEPKSQNLEHCEETLEWMGTLFELRRLRINQMDALPEEDTTLSLTTFLEKTEESIKNLNSEWALTKQTELDKLKQKLENTERAVKILTSAKNKNADSLETSLVQLKELYNYLSTLEPVPQQATSQNISIPQEEVKSEIPSLKENDPSSNKKNGITQSEFPNPFFPESTALPIDQLINLEIKSEPVTVQTRIGASLNKFISLLNWRTRTPVPDPLNPSTLNSETSAPPSSIHAEETKEESPSLPKEHESTFNKVFNALKTQVTQLYEPASARLPPNNLCVIEAQVKQAIKECDAIFTRIVAELNTQGKAGFDETTILYGAIDNRYLKPFHIENPFTASMSTQKSAIDSGLKRLKTQVDKITPLSIVNAEDIETEWEILASTWKETSTQVTEHDCTLNKAIVIEERLKTLLYKTSNTVMNNIRVEYLRIFGKYNQDTSSALIQFNRELFTPSKIKEPTTGQSNALNLVDPRLLKLLSIYNHFKEANAEYINTDLELLNDKAYHMRLLRLIDNDLNNDKMEQMSDDKRSKLILFFRFHIVKPFFIKVAFIEYELGQLKDVFKNWWNGVIPENNPLRFYPPVTRLPCKTEEVLLETRDAAKISLAEVKI